MISDYKYNQFTKQKVREDILKHVIDLLTTKRSKACCVRRSYVRELYEWFITQNYDIKSNQVAKKLPIEYIKLWEDFHQSFIGYKEAKDLTVCYLSGPQPMNDFEVLVNHGIHPHNIWAFEIDKGTYNNALKNIDKSSFPMLKILKGSIEQFFLSTPKKFDIVYLDFCGAIPSSQHITRIIASLMKHQRLNSPGALITNIACPDIRNSDEKDKYSHLMAHYLFFKKYLEDNQGCTIENTFNNINEMLNEINSKFELYYSQFITRQLFDMATIITPWVRLANSSFWRKFFNVSSNGIANKFDLKNIMPLSKTIQSIMSSQNKFKQFDRNWLNELGGYPISATSIDDIIYSYDVLKSNSDCYTVNMSKIIEEYLYEDKMFQFCDKPNKNLAFDLVTNQLSYPMHYCTETVMRKEYIAKQTKMFTDAIIFDECRYIYEWLPTIDLLNNAFDDIGQQLTYRFALDGLVKNRMWYNTEYFYSGSVVSIYDNNDFNAYTLAPRYKVVDDFRKG
ncbi:MAG: class I SAM-dependent methyltransferase [Marinisporobacter sp.]|jgi:hypothetical protein|nr:class I SAM-dependent methyltransferase [Marinisporobacter sp.]